MQLGLLYDQTIAAISNGGQSIVEEFRQLVSAIQNSWNLQHAADGTHGAVTATGLSVSAWRWKTLKFAPELFTTNAPGVAWTVTAANININYAVHDDVLILWLYIIGTNVPGAGATALRVTFPEGLRGQGGSVGGTTVRNAGVWAAGFGEVAAGATYVDLYLSGLGAYTLTAGNNTDVRGVLHIPLTHA